MRSDRWQPGPGRLTLADREEISLGLREGASFTAIARRLAQAVSTVSREVAGNGGRGGYRAWRAHQQARDRARRPKTPKLGRARLAAQVTTWLKQWWSPQEIAGRLRIEYPGDPMMQVSHETIYQALFVQGRGELRRELARCLRTGRIQRRPRRRPENTGQLRDMVMISERPAEVEDRAVPGHWEGDLLIGAGCRTAVGHPGRADHPLRDAAAPTRRAERLRCGAGDARNHLDSARAAAPQHHLGPRQGDGPPRPVHGLHRRAGLLLRPPQALATRLEREHERAPAPAHA